MKVNEKINKRVNDSVAECHKVLTDSIINLLKSVGVESCREFCFGRVLFLYQTKNNVSETIVADRIVWCDSQEEGTFFIVTMNGKMAKSHIFMSISNLQAIYEEIKRVIRSK